MRIVEITFRHRNDFHFIAECNCGHRTRWGDGYADAYYQQEVFPHRHCPHCGLDEYGNGHEDEESTVLDQDGSAAFVEALLNPAHPNEALLRAAANYQGNGD